MGDIFLKLKNELGEKLKRDEILAPYTTFKIGGPARYFYEANSEQDIINAVKIVKKLNITYYILGGGSNILISDSGFNGLIIKIGNNWIAIKDNKIKCGAGASLVKAARLSIANNLSGLEWSIGIQGATIGGAVKVNAEAFNSPMSNIVEIVSALNIKKNKFEIFDNKDCKFNYRQSIFKDNNNYIIWETELKLTKASSNKIKKLIKESINHRNKKYPKFPSAGSIFKNIPYEFFKKNSKELADKLLNAGIARLGNIGAGLIIEKARLKGKAIGGAKISLEHGNFIVNTGNATAENVIMLISIIKQKVRANYGIQLEEEIELVGF
ncbi:UDP-N-acetylmuramate dehydrogenase [Candidatus Parcubacteria bacterium]|nr:UDP-N-acetylmuramate dehydrogenase [Candidatus Parcubacteria bacterium]